MIEAAPQDWTSLAVDPSGQITELNLYACLHVCHKTWIKWCSFDKPGDFENVENN